MDTKSYAQITTAKQHNHLFDTLNIDHPPPVHLTQDLIPFAEQVTTCKTTKNMSFNANINNALQVCLFQNNP